MLPSKECVSTSLSEICTNLTFLSSKKNAAFPTWHRCSFALTIVNIICIILTGIIILKVKQVTSDKIPQRNHSFWKQDIKVHK